MSLCRSTVAIFKSPASALPATNASTIIEISVFIIIGTEFLGRIQRITRQLSASFKKISFKFLALSGHLSSMLTLIIGTNRPNSNTRKVAAQVEQVYRELKVPLAVIDLAELPTEIFAATSYAQKP